MTDAHVNLQAKLSTVIGGRSANALGKGLGLVTIEDLLRHYPRRYAERGELTDLASLHEGEQVTVMAEVVKVTIRPMRNRRGTILEAIISDGTSSMSLTFFNQPWREEQLKVGRRGLFAGQVGRFKDQLQLTHPEFELLPDGVDDGGLTALEYAGKLIPIYPSSKGVTSWQIAKTVKIVLELIDELPDPIPEALRKERGLLGMSDALWSIHRPTSRDDVRRATERLRFEEAFVLQALLAQRREEVKFLPATRRIPDSTPLLDAFDARLPFQLTAGQRDVTRAIEEDMALEHPMHRLLQGDVGSGKTVVALRAMLRIVDAGGQAALLAPTEVLAVQHYRSITQLLGPLAERGQLGAPETATHVALLTGSLKTAKRRSEMIDILTGDAGIVVGTHALIQEKVDFFDLALVVVDEQHRFGVEQRAALAEKSRDGSRPHVLVMTATPIPRTVAMTVFGDVDVSTLTELPAGRAAVTTHVVGVHEQPAFVDRAWARAREEVAAGHRVFVVCPRIGDDDDEGEDDGSRSPFHESGRIRGPRPESVLALAARLADGPLEGLSIGILHGRMASEEKDEVVRRFADPDATEPVEVLVSTTVIEVGVDIPAATMMVIVDADRFGISQLHQLRGRVGRGGLPGLCLLLTQSEPGSPSRERLDAVASTTDGFELSALDLQQRREGDVLGSSQSGRRSSLRLLEVTRHEDVIVDARQAAFAVVADDPTLARQPALAAAIYALSVRDQSDYLEQS